ncbi:MAG: hypothetical protein ACYCSS_11450 [Sulfuriferula sp.]
MEGARQPTTGCQMDERGASLTNISSYLSNPYSTGGGGNHFEARVQASFVIFMLAGGFAPCLPCLPISKIKLQGKYAGYDTDDLIVFVKDSQGLEYKMLAQVKHSITLTENNKIFREVIHAAWNDYNNPDIFTKNRDVIALITGPLSVTDVNDVRPILEWARHAESATEFFQNVDLANFSSDSKRKKLLAFRNTLNLADGNPVADEVFFDFMKHFHLLGYDLDIKSGVTLSLLHSLIGQYSPDNTQNLWARIVEEVQVANQNAGTITCETLPDDLKSIFKQRTPETIHPEFVSPNIKSTEIDWSKHAYASDLVIANLLGAWDEQNKADTTIIAELIPTDYDEWVRHLREILLSPETPFTLNNGKWHINNRKVLWQALGTRIFDNDLDTFKPLAITILTERDPQFELPVDERYTANIYGKVLQYSSGLRRGMAESLVLLGSQASALSNCSQNKAVSTAILSVREILDTPEWVRWASLNNQLSLMAEAAPEDFLDAVEKAFNQSPCPFDEIFAQESNGITGGNYITGLLWALETLAWDSLHLVRACEMLGLLAARDPGGNWGNRPKNSLKTILLPWFPQTIANVEKRNAVLTTLENEVPEVAWDLVLSLLPNQQSTSMGTHKPLWRDIIPDGWNDKIAPEEYWKQVSFYADRAVAMAGNDTAKLSALVRRFNNLPESNVDDLLKHMSSEAITSKSEDERLQLWSNLSNFIAKQKQFSNSSWTFDAATVGRIESVTAQLAPKNLLNLYRRLFDGRDIDHYEEIGNWETQRERLEERRRKAIKDILNAGGTEAVIQFAEYVESPRRVGNALGSVAGESTDLVILPLLLKDNNKQLTQFVEGYASNRQQVFGWAWVDRLDKTNWTVTQVATLLSFLPFTHEAWNRAAALLGDSECEYWSIVNVQPYDTNGDFRYAIDKLIKYERPRAASHCLNYRLHLGLPLDVPSTVRTLLAAVSSSETSYVMDDYLTTLLIKALQDDPSVDAEDLFRVEWVYLPLLDHRGGAGPEAISPTVLEKRLASDPAFFSEVIRLVYRSTKETESEKEHDQHDEAIATNAWRLLEIWELPPGTQPDGTFLSEAFNQWLQEVKQRCAESGHLDVALTCVGRVLFYSPPDSQDLWIDRAVAKALNAKDADAMRNGYSTKVYNSRGAHFVDPTGDPERELAKQYRDKADIIENAGYQRFAVTLRGLAESYDHEADRIVMQQAQGGMPWA